MQKAKQNKTTLREIALTSANTSGGTRVDRGVGMLASGWGRTERPSGPVLHPPSEV